jgi:hypothetical protein
MFSEYFSIHYRFQGDFTNDGIQDLLLSAPARTFGNAGGYFTAYVGLPTGTYLQVGELFCRPAVSRFDISPSGQGILSTYLRVSAASGGIAAYHISPDGIAIVSSEPIDFTQAHHEAYFMHFFREDALLTPEYCLFEEGEIVWKPGEASYEEYYRQDFPE